jgi:hypothetical protein
VFFTQTVDNDPGALELVSERTKPLLFFRIETINSQNRMLKTTTVYVASQRQDAALPSPEKQISYDGADANSSTNGSGGHDGLRFS